MASDEDIFPNLERFIGKMHKVDLKKKKISALNVKKIVTVLTEHPKESYNNLYPIGNFETRTGYKPWSKPQWLHSAISILIYFDRSVGDMGLTNLGKISPESALKLTDICLALIQLDPDGPVVYEHMKSIFAHSKKKVMMVDTNSGAKIVV